MNDPDAYDEVAKIKSAVDLRVLCLCQRYVDYGNIITATQSEIASQLGLHQQNVSASMKRLESMGFVRKMGKRGTVNKWALSPRLLFMGKPRDHKVAILKYDAGEDWA
ncbi:MAG: hypothetical protein GOVbin631_67 [Prokaryotic dsDNA virus sp.]|nr:MAG: hypothetical protein GOVbin631_67 [Prokaryotic dsDNA virus sp.]|tara:strand:+ start:4385 stop:4708 length:324 start_codon:yes stop_codon:yes gene_type:complete